MTPEALLPLALGFGNLLMLGWLAAAAAPLIIHLWNKRKYHEVSWAAVEFLLAAMRKNARRVQLQQWLLLAVRTLLIVLVVLAVAEPFLERAGLSFVAGKRTHKLLVLDGSFSMEYRPTDISRFARAKQIAAQIVEESRQGDGFTLVLMSAPPRIVVGTPAMEPRDFLEELESLMAPQGGADLTATLGLVEEVLDRARREVPGLERHEVFFLTDLGRNTWAPDVANPGAHEDKAGGSGAVSQQAERLARNAALSIIDLGQVGSQNLAVTRLAPLESFATVARDVTFEAQVRNFGNQASARQLVELLVDDARVKEEYIDLEPGAQATLSFSHRFETPGQHVIQVRLASDKLLAVDNQRWLSLDVKDHLRVLCVGGQEGSTRYVANALDPERGHGEQRSLVRPQIVPESALVELDLEAFDCIFLCNVGQFTAVEARLLDSYLRQGGGLVFFLGDRVLAERYNRELAGEGESKLRVLPVRIGPIVDEAQYQLDPLDYRHPIVNVFRGSEQAGLLTSPVYKYFKLEKPAEWTQSRIALAFAGGDPAIVEEPIHRGRSIVVALPASLESVDPVTKTPWTMMPVWPSFPPIVQELLATAVSSRTAGFNAIVGEPLGRPVASSAANSALTITLPDGRKQPVRLQADIDETQWSFAATDESGVYTAQFDAPPSREVFAVNVDTAESDLTKAEPDELPHEFTVKTDWQNLDQQPAEEIGRRSGLHRLLLYAGLMLLLVEPCLAWWFSRGSA